MALRYNSPATQLSLIALTLLLTTFVRRLVDNFTAQTTPVNENLAYDRYLSTSIIAVLSGILAIFLVNLLGIRFIFLLYAATNILYAASLVSAYREHSWVFQKAAMHLNAISYDFSRVATLVVVLSYPGERWKARAIGVFLFIEYTAITLGDIVAIKKHDSGDMARYHASLSYLAVSFLAPLPALAILPSSQVMRDDGLFLLTRDTTLKRELWQTARIFKNKYMLLLLPYMFSYPFVFGSANVSFPQITILLIYDAGKLCILLLGQMLDVKWAGRRIRGLVAFSLLVGFFIVSIIITVYLRCQKFDFSGIQLDWPKEKIMHAIADVAIQHEYRLLLTNFFFAGVASGFIELFGYWVMGTLTNDLQSSARFVGTYHSVMAVGGMLGFQLTNALEEGSFLLSNVPLYVALSCTFISFVLLYLVVRRISETNDWTLGRILNARDQANGSGGASVMAEEQRGGSSQTITIITDVKYEHS